MLGTLHVQVYVDQSEPSRPQKFYGVFNKHCREIARFKFRKHLQRYLKEYSR
jgi:hypothetical protein